LAIPRSRNQERAPVAECEISHAIERAATRKQAPGSAEDLVSVAAIVLVFLVAGLFVGKKPGRLLSDRLERIVLYRVPGYLMVRRAVGSFLGLSGDV
jgi:hypothetical protein